MSEEKGQEVL